MTTAMEAFDRMFDILVGCFTPDVAERVANLRGDPILQARLDELADKCTEGELTPDERTEYKAYVHAMDMIAIVMAKACKLVREANSS